MNYFRVGLSIVSLIITTVLIVFAEKQNTASSNNLQIALRVLGGVGIGITMICIILSFNTSSPHLTKTSFTAVPRFPVTT